MPRKPTVYDLRGTEDVGRVVRSDHRAAMEELKDLANHLAALPPGQRRGLPLDEEVLAEIERLAVAGQRPDRRRLLMRVKLMLGESDLGPLRAFLAGETPAAIVAREAEEWRTRLLHGGDDLLQRFIHANPAADRQALRTALREARAEAPPEKRAAQRVFRLLCDALSAAGKDQVDAEDGAEDSAETGV